MGIFILIIIIIVSLTVIPKIINKARNSAREKESITVFENMSGFYPDRFYVSVNSGVSVGIDGKRKLICFLDPLNNPSMFNYNKVAQCELIIDGASVYKSSTPEVIGRSIIGNVISKKTGAIVGGTTSSMTKTEKINSIRLKVIVCDINNPVYNIDFLQLPTDKGSFQYNTAYSTAEIWYALIQGVIQQK